MKGCYAPTSIPKRFPRLCLLCPLAARVLGNISQRTSGELQAQQKDGRWIVEVVQSNDQTPVQPDVAPSMGEFQQLRAEIEHLRESLARRDTQIDQLNTILAMQTQQNDSLVAKLPNPHTTFAERLHPILVQLRLTPPR